MFDEMGFNTLLEVFTNLVRYFCRSFGRQSGKIVWRTQEELFFTFYLAITKKPG